MKYKALLSTQSLEKLVEQFELTSDMDINTDVATVRGWLMDEIESRNPKGFDKFLDGFYEDSELRNFVL